MPVKGSAKSAAKKSLWGDIKGGVGDFLEGSAAAALAPTTLATLGAFDPFGITDPQMSEEDQAMLDQQQGLINTIAESSGFIYDSETHTYSLSPERSAMMAGYETEVANSQASMTEAMNTLNNIATITGTAEGRTAWLKDNYGEYDSATGQFSGYMGAINTLWENAKNEIDPSKLDKFFTYAQDMISNTTAKALRPGGAINALNAIVDAAPGRFNEIIEERFSKLDASQQEAFYKLNKTYDEASALIDKSTTNDINDFIKSQSERAALLGRGALSGQQFQEVAEGVTAIRSKTLGEMAMQKAGTEAEIGTFFASEQGKIGADQLQAEQFATQLRAGARQFEADYGQKAAFASAEMYGRQGELYGSLQESRAGIAARGAEGMGALVQARGTAAGNLIDYGIAASKGAGYLSATATDNYARMLDAGTNLLNAQTGYMGNVQSLRRPSRAETTMGFISTGAEAYGATQGGKKSTEKNWLR